jgi:ABC-2 type transport system permease protein
MALRPPVGSTLWLLAHELRLNLRTITGRKGGPRALIIAGLLIVVVAVFGGAPVARYLLSIPMDLTASLVASFDTGLLVVFTMVLSQTLSLATLALFERGDLELLLSSPLPPQRILAARAAAIATAPFLWFSALASIAVVPLSLYGQPRWLAVYPVIAAIALLASSAGIGLSLGLFRLLGARRTREAGQMIATVIGAAFFLIIQIRSFLPGLSATLFAPVARWTHSGVFDPAAPLAWPARAVLGDPLPLLAFVAASLVVFMAMAAGLGRRFSGNVAAAAGAGPAVVISRGAVGLGGFRGGLFVTILRKEFRLLRRDPTLLSQVLLRTLYVAPLTFAMLRTATGADAAQVEHLRLASLAGSVAFLASQVAGSLAWICISAEDAPDLLVCAPIHRRLARRAKIAAALLPVGLLLAAPIVVLTVLSPVVGIFAALGAAAAGFSAIALNLWLEKPMPRRTFRNRRESSALTAICEIIVGLVWALAAWLGAAFVG